MEFGYSRLGSFASIHPFFSVDSDIDYPQKLSGSNTCTTINQRAAGRLLWPPLFMLSLKGQKDKKILETHIYII